MPSKPRTSPPPPDPAELLPSNIEVERWVLGALLMDSARHLPDVRDLRAADFSLEKHRRIFLRAMAVDERGEKIDRITVADELKRHGQLDSVDGLGYLVSLDSGLPEIANLPSYVRILREAALRRRVIVSADGLGKLARVQTEDIGSVIADAEELFRDLRSEPRGTAQRIESLPSVWSYKVDYEYIVPGFLAKGTVNLLTGESGDGKSTVALKLAGCVARGEPFLGRPTMQREVVYLDRENPILVVQKRLERLGIPETPELHVWGGWIEVFPEGPDSPEVLRFVKQYQPLIVFDNKVTFDGGDEQDAGDTRRHMVLYRRLATLGGTVLLLHNSGKSESSRQYRGSSDIKASVDAAYLLERTDGSDSGGPLGSLRLKPFKNRLTPGESIRFEYANGDFSVADVPPPTHFEVLEGILRLHPSSTQAQLIRLVQPYGIAKGRLPDLLLQGHNSGRFEFQSGKKGAKRWSLREPDLM